VAGHMSDGPLCAKNDAAHPAPPDPWRAEARFCLDSAAADVMTFGEWLKGGAS
jgi:hypothetical protein